MPREKECYRLNLERLDEIFPGREILKLCEVADFLGVDKRTAKAKYGISSEGISKVKLANILS